MSRYLFPTVILIAMISLDFFSIATASSRGPDAATVSLDEIESSVASSLDLGNSNVEQTAVTIAKDYPGEYNINQVSEIFKTLRKGWFYFSDPSYKNKYKNANLTLQDGKMSNTIGMGNCDDFAIIMASLIASLGGSTRITFASNASSTEGHAYCELFLGYENDSQVNDLINWTKAEYSLEEIPGLDKTGNEVWMNLDWWADYIGGPYFEDDRGIVVWQSDRLISPKIVPIIDTMDSTAGWETLKDGNGSNISISSYPTRNGLGIAISYDLKDGGWVGIAKNVTPDVLVQVEGLNFSCSAADKHSNIEMRLVYADGTEYGYSWKPDLGKWVKLQALYEDFKCLKSGDNCSSPNGLLDPNKVEKLDFIIHSESDDGTGSGKVVIDQIQGVMNIPAGSPWARAEEQIKKAIAKDLASRSETYLKRPSSLIESITLAIESLKTYETSSGDKALRQGLGLLLRPIAQLDHSDAVNSVAFSPNGKMLATGSDDCSARIWDAETGRKIAQMHHDKPIIQIIFSPDSKKLATASDDHTAKIWDVKTGNELAHMNHDDVVWAVAFSPDEKILASASSDYTARLWDVDTGKELARMNHDENVSKVKFSPDGKKVATASSDNTARIWDCETGRELARMTHNGSVTDIALSPNGNKLATVCEDHLITIWNGKTSKALTKIKVNNKENLCCVVFSPDGKKLATASYASNPTTNLGNVAIIWDVETGKELARMNHQGYVNIVLFSPDGDKIATASDDYTARLWDAETGKELARMNHNGFVLDVTFSTDGTRLATASWDKTAKIWDAETSKAVVQLKHDDEVWTLSYSPDGKMIATASFDKTAKIWDAKTYRELFRLDHDDQVWDAKFSPDGRKLATASSDGTAKIWDIRTGKELYQLIHAGPVNVIAFSPDGKWLATGSRDKTARIWDVETGQELVHINQDYWVNEVAFDPTGNLLATIEDYPSMKAILWETKTGKAVSEWRGELVYSIAFSPDRKRLAVGCADGTARIWNMQTGMEPILLKHDGPVLSLVFNNEGTKLATASEDKTARIWDVFTGKELAMMNHENEIYFVAFSPDGKELATASNDQSAKIFDVETGREISKMDHDTAVTVVAFSPDGKNLATVGLDDFARIWMLGSQNLICEACSRLGCNLTSKDWWEEYCSECNESNTCSEV